MGVSKKIPARHPPKLFTLTRKALEGVGHPPKLFTLPWQRLDKNPSPLLPLLKGVRHPQSNPTDTLQTGVQIDVNQWGFTIFFLGRVLLV